MNGKKITSMIFKTLNYTNEIKKKSTNGHGGRRQLFKSLRHSLRIPASQPKKLEWLDEQSHLNLIWLPETGTIKLDDYPKEKREALLAKIADEAEAPTVVKNNRAELLETRTKLKNKVKNASKKETDDGSILAFQNILNVSGIADTEQLLSDLDQFDIKRKGQKLDTARQFLECHNEIERGPKPLIKKNQAVIQEAFFKFPSKNEVSGISAEKRISLIKDFYEVVFPEYPIHLVVLHGDEDADLKDHSDHPHIFISTKSSKTGRYDLRETQINKVNAYLKKHRPEATPISEKPDFLESQLLFGYLQDMFYVFTNNRLLKDTPYTAKKNEKTESHMKQLRYINSEARKPKSEREFSLYQQVKEKRDHASQDLNQAQKQAAEAKDYTQKAKQYVSVQLSKAEQAKTDAKDAIERQRLAEQATAEEYEQAEAYRRRSAISQQTIVNNNTESARIRAEIAKDQATLELFRTNLSALIDGVVGWIGELFAERRQEIQDKFLKQARSAFERVAANDKTKERKYTKAAETEVDNQLTVLDKYQELFPNTPKAHEVKKMIIKPK
ncbi:hypothetical protein [Pseudomonas aeruginosa]|uniref:hypothetical protein n=1 Tax=Pseudomonas aeruginosa TaxID=287 RepID=UPI000A7A2F41|nr:hypothetical protein [Pseudomonas aeruginosa]MCM8587830.1 hypothetical protein [Pseudomonas aeruginosa]MCM8671741.1 hypothetical protein [Pseudomonas aeruginosa]MCP2651688.1 hypothetical protein [Pseudomonas aeruginosa]RUC63404.1 hypothetical protein IPC1389_17295 [Pseudomonas aeruginosa]WBH34403.1 hypothetical protein PALA4_03080 [Pseudomonas aeruginosa]